MTVCPAGQEAAGAASMGQRAVRLGNERTQGCAAAHRGAAGALGAAGAARISQSTEHTQHPPGAHVMALRMIVQPAIS